MYYCSNTYKMLLKKQNVQKDGNSFKFRVKKVYLDDGLIDINKKYDIEITEANTDE